MYHYVTPYEGHRHCIVLTNKESVRKTLPHFEKAYQERMNTVAEVQKTVAEVQMKDKKDRSKEQEFLDNFPKADKEGKRAVFQLLWELEWAREHRPKSQKDKHAKGNGQKTGSEEDGPDQPPPKKQKTSESE